MRGPAWVPPSLEGGHREGRPQSVGVKGGIWSLVKGPSKYRREAEIGTN